MEFNVINIRADGSMQKSMKGVVVPRIPATEAFYRHIEEELRNGELVKSPIQETKRLA